MELIDPWKGTTQAANTLAALGQQIQQEKKNDQASQLAALQMQQLQSANAEKEATDTALIDTYGTGDRGDRTAQLAAAKSFQAQKAQMDGDLKSDQATVKEIYDLVGKMKDKGIGPDAITPLVQGYASQIKSPQLRQLYSNLQLTNGWGAKTKVAINGTEGYTHPITGQPLAPGEYEMEFDQNQKPTKVNLIKQGAPANAPKSLAELNSNLDYVLREPNATDAQVRLGELAAETGVGGKDLDSVRDMVSKQYTDKADKTQVVEIPAPDGKTAQKYLVNTATGEQKPVGKPYAVKSQVANVNVHTGSTSKPPTGYRFAADGQTLEPIPGGPADPNNNSKKGGNKQLSGKQLEDLTDQGQILKTLREAQELSKKVQTGPISGRVQSAGQTVGISGKEFNDFKQKLATANNIMLKARSGAAVTDQEYARFQQEMPSVNDTENVRDQKLTNAIGYMTSLLDNKMANLQEGGYRIPEGLVARSKLGSTAQPRKAAPAQPQKPKTASDYLSKFK